MTIARPALLGALAVGGCLSSPGVLPLDGGLYDDLRSGSVSGALWDEGQFRIALEDGAAVLAHDVRSARPDFTHRTRLVAVPPGSGYVTALRSDVTLAAASATGDTAARAGIELLFQAPDRRLQRPADLYGALVVRIMLQRTAAGLAAIRQVIECPAGAPDCRLGQVVGTASGDFPQGTAISAGVRYTLGVSVDASRGLVAFSVSGGGLDLGALIDVSGVTTASAPFLPDLSAGAFQAAILEVGVRGGAEGGGDGAATARFDDVWLGTDGGAAALFDDFGAGPRLDPARWRTGGAQAESGSSGLTLRLDEADLPAAAAVNLARKTSAGLQADVTVTEHVASGSGRVAAELWTALYNDGSGASAPGPDANQPDSQVGDLVAVLAVTDAAATWAVIRCDSPLCDRYTIVRLPTPLGAAALGTRHTLSARWDPAAHTARFQLDGGPAVTFDPSAWGHPVAGAPRSPTKRLAVVAGKDGTDPFTSGSVGALTATFTNVRVE